MYRYGRFESLDNHNYFNSWATSVGLYRFDQFVSSGADRHRCRNRYREYEHFSDSRGDRGALLGRSDPGKSSGGERPIDEENGLRARGSIAEAFRVTSQSERRLKTIRVMRHLIEYAAMVRVTCDCGTRLLCDWRNHHDECIRS